jgi:phage shock protein A
MRILDRMGLLIRADAHGVMDQLEERSLLLKQHLREAEIELDRKRARLEASEEQLRHMRDDARGCEQQIAELDRDVELALAEGEEELARFAVRRLLPTRRRLRELRKRIAELEEGRERLGERLQAQEGELDLLRSRVRGRLAEMQQRDSAACTVERAVADEDVELELLRRRAAAGTAVASETGVQS